MKIADALQIQRAISEETNRLRKLAEQDSWRWSNRGAGEKLEPSFDLEENHKRVRNLSKLSHHLSRAVSIANNVTDLAGISDGDYKDWL